MSSGLTHCVVATMWPVDARVAMQVTHRGDITVHGLILHTLFLWVYRTSSVSFVFGLHFKQLVHCLGLRIPFLLFLLWMMVLLLFRTIWYWYWYQMWPMKHGQKFWQLFLLCYAWRLSVVFSLRNYPCDVYPNTFPYKFYGPPPDQQEAHQ